MTKSDYWSKSTKTLFTPLRATDSHTKHLIVGGGIAGLATAYFLLERGETDIMLIEQHTIGSGSTGHSAGMLVSEPEGHTWATLEAEFGKTLTRHYHKAHIAAYTLIRSLIETQHIPCDYMPQELLLLAETPHAFSRILKEFKARQHIHAHAELLKGSSLAKEINIKRIRAAERTKHNISVNPLLFAQGFAKYLAQRGVRIFEHTQLIALENTMAQTTHGSVSFDQVFFCRGTYEKDKSIERFLTTIGVTRKLTTSELKALHLLDKDMFADDGKRSFHYGKITKNNRMLVGYGDLKMTGTPKKKYTHTAHIRSIEHFLKSSFPHLTLPLEYSWSAEYALTHKHVPLVRKDGALTTINGAGTQLGSVVAAAYAVAKMRNKRHVLDPLFLPH